jgi:hypothetical protein
MIAAAATKAFKSQEMLLAQSCVQRFVLLADNYMSASSPEKWSPLSIGGFDFDSLSNFQLDSNLVHTAFASTSYHDDIATAICNGHHVLLIRLRKRRH